MKGEFEQRLRQVIDEVEKSPKPIVLFVDEVHTLVGAGGTAGTGDAANLLKPALARGRLRTIGATTWSEYKKYIEKDPALTRRFQISRYRWTSPPSPRPWSCRAAFRPSSSTMARSTPMLRSKPPWWSHRDIRQLPDKAVSLLDTACARVALSQHALPAAIEDLQRRIEALGIERGIAQREAAIGVGEAKRVDDIAAEVAAAQAELDLLEKRRVEEATLVERIVTLRKQLSPAAVPVQAEEAAAEDVEGDDVEAAAHVEAALAEPERAPEEIRAELNQAQAEARAAAGRAAADPWARSMRRPLPPWWPTGRASPSAAWCATTRSRCCAWARFFRRAWSRSPTRSKPFRAASAPRARGSTTRTSRWCVRLAAPLALGKTETALALSEALDRGGEQNLVTINMSEFQESHTVSTLKGAPPGYVGYGEGGVLTEAVRRRPYSVVLLDEIEKAHTDVHEIFFQVFDKGWMEDGEGRHIDFRNTVIIMTSNVGTDLVMQLCEDPTRARSSRWRPRCANRCSRCLRQRCSGGWWWCLITRCTPMRCIASFAFSSTALPLASTRTTALRCTTTTAPSNWRRAAAPPSSRAGG